MGRTLSNKLTTLPAARRKAIEGRAADLIAEEMSLRELRRALGRTQVKVAQDLGIGQEAVSKLETRTDMLLSTLARYVGPWRPGKIPHLWPLENPPPLK